MFAQPRLSRCSSQLSSGMKSLSHSTAPYNAAAAFMSALSDAVRFESTSTSNALIRTAWLVIAIPADQYW